MKFSISKGRLAGARYVKANSFGGSLKPEIIILHDTAGRLDKFNSVGWFASKECKTSAHIVVERDGTITQMVPFDRKAFHAGVSAWKGRKFCNSFAIGIEIVNPGKMDKNGVAWFGPATSEPVEQKTTQQHGSGYWLGYTAAQIDAVKNLCRSLCEEYPDLNDITTHWAVSPGRKIDPNPLFPLEEVNAYALGEGDSDDVPVAAPVNVPVPKPVSDNGVTVPELSKVSTKVRTIKNTGSVLHAIWMSIVGLLSLENVGFANGAVNDIKTLVDGLALPGLAVMAIGGVRNTD